MEQSIQFWESKRIKVVASHLILKIARAGSLAMLIGGLFFMLITCSVEKVYSCFWFVFCWASTFNLWSRYAFVWQGESTLLTGTYRLRGAFQLSLWLTSLSSLLQAWVCSCGCPLNSLQFFQQYPWSVGTSMKPHTPISCASPRPEDNRASAGTWHPSSVQPAPWTCLASSRWANYASYLSQSCRSCMFKKFPCTRFFNMPSISLIFLMYFFFLGLYSERSFSPTFLPVPAMHQKSLQSWELLGVCFTELGEGKSFTRGKQHWDVSPVRGGTAEMHTTGSKDLQAFLTSSDFDWIVFSHED